MKFVIAPDSFKGSLTAKQVAEAIHAGIARVFPAADYQLVPMADGGEGTVQSLVDATGGRLVTATVHNPLNQLVEASYGLLGDGETAAIEMAAASGSIVAAHKVSSGSSGPIPVRPATKRM